MKWNIGLNMTEHVNKFG